MHRRWTVGSLSQLLGIAAPTLRTWERRYGVGPTFRTAGGHRRYTIVDADRVATMARFIEGGLSAREAAERVKRLTPHDVAIIVGAGPEGLRSSAIEHAIGEIVAGAAEFDGPRIHRAAQDSVDRFGLEEAWDAVLAPALQEVGRSKAPIAAAQTRLVEGHALAALRVAAHDFAATGPSRIAVATVAPGDPLPVVALASALAGHHHRATELGSLPLDALEAFVVAARPDLVFVWAQSTSVEPQRLLALGEEGTVLLGGPGWASGAPATARMSDAVARARKALGDELP